MNYCCKEETRISPCVYTNIRNEIDRVALPKLVEIRRFIDANSSVIDIMDNEKYFSTWVSHHRSLDLYVSNKQKKCNFKTMVVYFYGPSGVGKSRLALDIAKHLYPESEPFYKTKGIWWDLNNYNDVVKWNDYRGDCYEPQELFKLTDRYDYKIQIKGGYLNLISKVIIFTSNVPSDFLYKDNRGQPFERRINFNLKLESYAGLHYTVKYGDAGDDFRHYDRVRVRVIYFKTVKAKKKI
ncbi:uncharacterized protein LOC136093183 [Hydra vulgaris]|uniref:uncharacterized protein LOC136093183 n=1 Tax=Hydra vulgaris TaxID=6087 RepID=UPI0032EA0F49